MIIICKTHIENIIAAQGINRIFTDPEDLSKYLVFPYAAIFTNPVRYIKDGFRVGKEDDLVNKIRKYRRRIYQTILILNVALVHKTEAQADSLATAFLQNLGSRFLDGDGNSISIQAESGESVIDPSILKQRAAAEIKVGFIGGIYKDETVPIIPLSTGLDPVEEITTTI